MTTHGKFRGKFICDEFPKPEYLALRWLMGELEAENWEILSLGIRLAALLRQGGLDLDSLHRVGQPQALQSLLDTFRARPKDEHHQTPIAPPHWTLKKPSQ